MRGDHLNQVMKTAPISDMKRNQSQVMSFLSDGPVVLMQRSQPAAVMVAPTQWNAIAEEVEELRDVIAALKAELVLSLGQEQPVTIDPDDLRQWMADDAIPA